MLRLSPLGSRRDHLVRLLPILFFFTYLTGTVLLFAFGPWPYPVADGTKLYLYLAAAHLALLAGYLTSAFRDPHPYTGTWTPTRLVGVGLIVNALLFVPTLMFRTGSATPDISAALANPGEAYALSFEARGAGLPLVEYIRIALGPLLALIPVVPTFYWKRIGVWAKVGTVVFSGGTAVTYVAMGTNKALADMVIVIPWIILAARLAGQFRFRIIIASWLTGVSVVAFSAFLLFFGNTQLTRAGANPWYFSRIGAFADEQNVLVRSFPEAGRRTAIGLSSYLTQGYYALYLALDKPFEPCFGVGHSMFLYRQVARIPAFRAIADKPYPIRIEADGWSAYGLFSSIYPWIASDVGFAGTLFVVFLVGRLLASTWIDAVKGQNPIAVALFGQMLIMLFYFSANNQCLQSGESLTAFWVTLVVWRRTRGRAPGRYRAWALYRRTGFRASHAIDER